MKIFHVLKHGVRGNGHVHVAIDLACEQADSGHRVAFVSSGGSYDELLALHGVEVITIPEPGGLRGTLRSALALLSVSRRIRPDVIHAHMMSSALLGFPVAKLVGAKLITTVHNSFEKHSVIMRLGKIVVAVSDAERQLLMSRGYKAKKVVTVLNGVDGSPRENLPFDDLGPIARPCVMTLSGLHRRKAVGDVMAAFALVHGDFPAWHLNIIGWGPDRERLEAMIEQFELTDHVHLLGTTLTPRPFLEQADVFATASLADPCPLTVAEARIAGCAVVGTSVGGIPELLDHGRAGLLTPAADPAAMAGSFRTLMGDPEVLASWRARAKHGAEYFSVERMARDYGQVYLSAVSGRRQSAGSTGQPIPASG